MALSQTVNKRVSGTITTQNLVPTGTATANSAVLVTCGYDTQSISFQISGAYTSGAANTLFGIIPQATIDGTNWFNIDRFVRLKASSFRNNLWCSNIPSAEVGMYQIKNEGYFQVRVCCISGAVTGTATVTMNTSNAPFCKNPQTAMFSSTLNLTNITPFGIGFFSFMGNALKNIRVKEITITGNGVCNIANSSPTIAYLLYRITSISAGTLNGMSISRWDTNDPTGTVVAAQAGITCYTTTPTPVGTAVFKSMVCGSQSIPATNVASMSYPCLLHNSYSNDGMDILLKGTGHGLYITNASVSSASGTQIQITVSWSEE